MIAHPTPRFNRPSDAGVLGLWHALAALPTAELLDQRTALTQLRGSVLWPLAATRYALLIQLLADRMLR